MWLCGSKSLLIYSVLLFVLLDTGECLQCYNCSSLSGGGCDFPLNKSAIFIQQCSYTQNRCIIINETIGGLYHIRRSCGREEYCPGNTRVFSVGCSDCSWDLCNSSSVTNFSFIVALMSIALAKMLRFCTFL